MVEDEQEVVEAPMSTPPQTAALAGRVVMVDGQPVASVTVRVEGLGLHQAVAGDGSFRIEEAPLGQHRLSVGTGERDGGFELIGPDHFDAGDEAIVLVARVSQVTFTAQDRDGAPALFRSLSLEVTPHDGTPMGGGGAYSSRERSSTTRALPPNCTVRAWAKGSQGIFAGTIETPLDGGALDLVLRSDSEDTATLELRVSGGIERLVEPRVHLRVRGLDAHTYIAAEQALERTMLVPGLAPGRYSLEVSLMQASGTEPEEALALTGLPREFEIEGPGPIPIDAVLAPGALVGLELVPSDSWTAEGGAEGAVTVEVTPQGAERPLEMEWWQVTDAPLIQCAFDMPPVGVRVRSDRSLAPGAYELRVEGEDFQPFIQDFEVGVQGGLVELLVPLVTK
ncbi:hypothetical protein [Engelhardtia mirabilis]|uniref:hypothetical protein n=1 Tax=Engelhardtia mirabilis TaxID=2528011 RepID=UPI0011AA03D5